MLVTYHPHSFVSATTIKAEMDETGLGPRRTLTLTSVQDSKRLREKKEVEFILV